MNSAYALRGLAAIDAAQGEPERAGRLFGAAESVLATLGSGYLLGEPVGLTALLAALVTGAGVALSTGILSKS